MYIRYILKQKLTQSRNVINYNDSPRICKTNKSKPYINNDVLNFPGNLFIYFIASCITLFAQNGHSSSFPRRVVRLRLLY